MSRKPAMSPPALEKPAQPGKLRAIALAILVHAAFFGLIVFGVSWQSKPTPAVQAELWDKLPPAKTTVEPAKREPRPEPPKPEPPKPQPKPEPKPEPPKPVDKPQAPKPDPAIAEKAEREKREKAKREKQKAEEEKKKRDEEELRNKREREELAKKRREEEEKRKLEEAARKQAQEAAEAAQKARLSEIDRFRGAIQAKIRGRANVPDTVRGNPSVVVLIRVLPGGEVLDITIRKRSSNPAYDAAIERAIRSASPLPVPPANHELFPQFRELELIFTHER